MEIVSSLNLFTFILLLFFSLRYFEVINFSAILDTVSRVSIFVTIFFDLMIVCNLCFDSIVTEIFHFMGHIKVSFSHYFFNKLKKSKYLKLELNTCSEIGGDGSSFIELSSGCGI